MVLRQLNHAPSRFRGITATYTHHRFTEEKRAALDLWGRILRDIVDPTPKVHVLKQAG